MTLRDFMKTADEAVVKEMLFNILDADIFVDCLEGDKFLVSNIEFNKQSNSLTMKLHKGDRRWIKISEHYQENWVRGLNQLSAKKPYLKRVPQVQILHSPLKFMQYERLYF